MDKVRQWLYYFIIGIISLIALVFLPMIGSTVGAKWNIPDTNVGWIVWVVTKIIVAALNILIFHSFMRQAKLNVRDNENFKEAQRILIKAKQEQLPKSPAKWNAAQYGQKGVFIFISTGLATVALTQAILSFDWVSMLTYLFTIVMGIIFGVLQMKKTEEYWTDEYFRYAKMIEEEQKKEKDQDVNV